MSRIRSKDTKPEMTVRKFLHANGFRYRLHVKGLLGRPDIVLPKYKTVVFVQGCFWHGHQDCKYFKIPSTRTDWWTSKIGNNIARDNMAATQLFAEGWTVIVIWECDLKPAKQAQTLITLVQKLKNS